MNQVNKKTRIMCEGALLIAASLILSYFKIQFLAYGSINLAMIPIIVFAYRWGVAWGVGAGAIFGTLKLILAGGFAFNWASILLDYTLAYAAVGFAGIFKGKKWGLPAGAFAGCFARYLVHFVSGITIYAITAPTEVMGLMTGNIWVYSLLYNISYMGPNTIIAILCAFLLQKPLEKLDK